MSDCTAADQTPDIKIKISGSEQMSNLFTAAVLINMFSSTELLGSQCQSLIQIGNKGCSWFLSSLMCVCTVLVLLSILITKHSSFLQKLVLPLVNMCHPPSSRSSHLACHYSQWHDDIKLDDLITVSKTEIGGASVSGHERRITGSTPSPSLVASSSITSSCN